MLSVVGLGNPGASYEKTRHNVGFMLLDGIVDGSFLDEAYVPLQGLDLSRRVLRKKPAFKKSRGPYSSIEVEIAGKRCCFIKPTTFMNESGKALSSLRTRGIFNDLSELLIVVDDIDLEIGCIRLRSRGSAGGHNGLKSIIRDIGTDEFARLRIGVGPRPNGDEMVGYVLSKFRPEELTPLKASLENAACIVGAWAKEGLQAAQNVFSRIS